MHVNTTVDSPPRNNLGSGTASARWIWLGSVCVVGVQLLARAVGSPAGLVMSGCRIYFLDDLSLVARLSWPVMGGSVGCNTDL